MERQEIEEGIKKRIESYILFRTLQNKGGPNSVSLVLPFPFTDYLGWKFKDSIKCVVKGDTIILTKVR